MLWGIGLGALYVVALIYWPAVLVLSPLLAFPVVGMFRLAALITRGESVSFWDGIREWRQRFGATLLCGFVITFATTILLINLLGGLQSADLLGWAFATLSAWGLLIGWLWVLCFWPLMTDPRREAWGLRGAARAAGYLVVAHPVRIGLLGVVIAIILVISTVAVAALVAISVAFVALIACRYVLPAADRLEVRLAAAGVHFGPATAGGDAEGETASASAERVVPA